MSSKQKTLAAYVLAIESIEERVTHARELIESLESLRVAEEVALVPAIYWKDEESVIGYLTQFPEHTFAESYLRGDCLMGQLATTLSHISVWRRLLESAHEGALVFEDDIYISDIPRFMEVIAEVQQRRGLEWVRIHLYKRYRDEVLQLRGNGLLVDDPMRSGFAAYYISRTGAKKMLARCHNISKPIDRLPLRMRQDGLLDSKTVTVVVVKHHAFEGDESGLQGRSEKEIKYDVQKSASVIYASPPVSENVELLRFISRLSNVKQLQRDGTTVLRGIFDKATVVQARQLVLDNRSLFKNTRPSPSAGHLPSFHRFPALELLHTMLSGNPIILEFLRFMLGGMGVRSIGLSDITINRSQHWHTDLLRGSFKTHMNGSRPWDVDGGGVYKVLLYLQDGASLKTVSGSHIKPISLDDDHYSEPCENANINTIRVHAGDIVIMDIRSTHCGAEESAYASGQWDDNPRILISTMLGGIDCWLTRAMETGNFYRLMKWMDSNP